jgi:hypothetical protein
MTDARTLVSAAVAVIRTGETTDPTVARISRGYRPLFTRGYPKPTSIEEAAMNVTVDELRSYYDALSRHEWTFDFSDDCRVWDKGRRELDYLQGMTTKNSRFAELFRDFSNYVWRSPPKPARP